MVRGMLSACLLASSLHALLLLLASADGGADAGRQGAAAGVAVGMSVVVGVALGQRLEVHAVSDHEDEATDLKQRRFA
eukprot:2017036-Rhodomonas_salina.1